MDAADAADIGQVGADMAGREAFQEIITTSFGSIAKWTVEIDDPNRVPEMIGEPGVWRCPSVQGGDCRRNHNGDDGGASCGPVTIPSGSPDDGDQLAVCWRPTGR